MQIKPNWSNVFLLGTVDPISVGLVQSSSTKACLTPSQACTLPCSLSVHCHTTFMVQQQHCGIFKWRQLFSLKMQHCFANLVFSKLFKHYQQNQLPMNMYVLKEECVHLSIRFFFIVVLIAKEKKKNGLSKIKVNPS